MRIYFVFDILLILYTKAIKQCNKAKKKLNEINLWVLNLTEYENTNILSNTS